ncbi:hypothetical protein HELRODRAFT_165560 [Helobdella robusta]|uniref:Uncharacterized protein n=1 Tax=Helobdella robusta TaxID=6412 RepID=T1EX05_HELRO|nr:hypothetical protein HELRODRAFT_165560 [Helobdella robusta]ESN91516.1 hypothetical protein HELRODRAFT_165560 [Helobdella robusta]
MTLVAVVLSTESAESSVSGDKLDRPLVERINIHKDYDDETVHHVVNTTPLVSPGEKINSIMMRMMSRDMLNCKVVHFPPPDQHLYCCQKLEDCQCPGGIATCSHVNKTKSYDKNDDDEGDEDNEDGEENDDGIGDDDYKDAGDYDDENIKDEVVSGAGVNKNDGELKDDDGKDGELEGDNEIGADGDNGEYNIGDFLLAFVSYNDEINKQKLNDQNKDKESEDDEKEDFDKVFLGFSIDLEEK